jgi:GDPmannose 4,6-dehydratase
MTTANKMKDYVIASGSTHSLRDFAGEVFRGFGLNLADHLIINESWKRPNEIARSALNPKRIHSDLGWKASIGIEEIARKLIAQELT